jgi:uncharacterized membrane protein
VPALAGHRPCAFVLLVTGLAGWAASAIQALERLELYEDTEHITNCDVNPWVSCGKVMGTWQSKVLGFPNPLIRIVAFAVVVATAMAVRSEARPGRWYWAGLQAGTPVAIAYVAVAASVFWALFPALTGY